MEELEIKKRIKYIDRLILEKSPCEKLENYNKKKVHKKQIAFHKCQKKNRWVFGGNRSGKTECGAVETVWLARGIHPYRKNKKDISCWVVSLTSQVQRDVAQEKILSYINPYWIKDVVMTSGSKDNLKAGVIDTLYIKNVFGGVSKIGFKSCDQGREKFQGTSLDFVWFDEEPPYDIYLEAKMRVIDRCGEIFGTMTPLKGLTWVYDVIYQNCNNDNNVWSIHMQWDDNPYLSKDEINSLSRSMSEDELNARKYGRFSSFGGMVYNNFDENINVIDPFDVPTDWYDNISIDPGLHNPLSAHWYACDYDGNVYVIAEWYKANVDIETHAKAIHDISNKLSWPKNNGKLCCLIDSAANQKTLSSIRSVTELFYDFDIIANPKVNKDLFAGISRVKRYICDANGNRKLFIFRNCVNLIREIKGYFWSDKDVPYKKDDHCLDELRYYIMSRPEPAKVIHTKSIITLDKERKMRRLKYGTKRYF